MIIKSILYIHFFLTESWFTSLLTSLFFASNSVYVIYISCEFLRYINDFCISVRTFTYRVILYYSRGDIIYKYCKM